MYKDLLGKLVHPQPLRTSECIPYHDYVRFDPCGHCCPEVFDSCRACKLGYPGWLATAGRPASLRCTFHYVEGTELKTLTDSQSANLIDDKLKRKEFDIFLCHNSEDKPAVIDIGNSLKRRGILPWLDTWEIKAGDNWIDALESQILTVKFAAVFLGPNGQGHWQKKEIQALLQVFTDRGVNPITVILPGFGPDSNIPLFLRSSHRVDFRKNPPNPMDELEWGITGIRRYKVR